MWVHLMERMLVKLLGGVMERRLVKLLGGVMAMLWGLRWGMLLDLKKAKVSAVAWALAWQRSEISAISGCCKQLYIPR